MYLLRSILCAFLIVVVLPNITYGSYRDEYLIEGLEPEDSDFNFERIRKRDIEPDAKPVISKKGTSEKKPIVKGTTKDDTKENVTTLSMTTTESIKSIESTTTNATHQESNSTYEVPVTTDFPDLPEDLPKNYTEGNATAHYVYYNSTFIQPFEPNTHWVDFNALPKEKVKTHPMLSSSHRRAATVTLPFDFPFYGHKVRNITIATGGFLYTGDYMHTWLAATQYIAPLMANFDTSIHNESTIKYADNGDNYTVQWEKVYLQDKTQEGPFTFQVTLHKSGDIEFVYKTVPISINDINDASHPVKVGLSDAYIMEKMVVFIRRKTIYEYHRADVSHFDIKNNSCIYFNALPTCQNFSNCEDCTNADIKFECSWCDTVSRCSTGLDRHRQDWINAKCDEGKPANYTCKAPTPAPIPTKPSTDKKPLSPSTTPIPPISSNTTSYPYATTDTSGTTYTLTPSAPPKLVTLPPGKKGEAISIDPAAARVGEEGPVEPHKHSVGAGSVIAILMIVCSVLGFAMWIGYAYKYPQSPSGQLLIRYRPSQWRWRHGEARYTAASIHI